MRYFEDFQVGDSFELGSKQVTEEDILAFARQFDPQPFHIDPEAAKNSSFGGIIASGWHTMGIFMRMFVDEILNKSASLVSPGVDEVRWLKPVRPGDVLRGRFIVTECTASRSRPEMGIVRSRCEALNQKDELVMTMAGIHFLGRRPTSADERAAL
ncbi:MAG: MaoC family dehydratase [Ktedonobacteraceae bacterium]